MESGHDNMMLGYRKGGGGYVIVPDNSPPMTREG
jgi:hypothetical protein